MAVPSIKVGDEVTLRNLKDKPIAVVLLNTVDHFCCVTKEGFTFNTSRAAANPLKTGKHYDAEGFLRSLMA